MPRVEASSFHNPFERLGHVAREIPAWTGRHWKSLALTLAALGFSGSSYMLVKGLSGGGHPEYSNPPRPGVSEPQKPPEVGLGVEVIPYPTSTPTSTPEATATAAPTPTEPPAPEDIKPFDCGILSPELCKTGEYVRWIMADGRAIDGVGFNFKKGIPFKIFEYSQVAASDHGAGKGSITAVNKNGERINIMGSVTSAEGLGKVGKPLPAGSIVGTSDDSESIFLKPTIRQAVGFETLELLKKYFPDIVKGEPEVIYRADGSEASSGSGGGKQFYDTPLPPTPTTTPQ